MNYQTILRTLPRVFLCLFTIYFGTDLYAQEENNRKNLNKERPKYIELGLGLNYSYFRDFATAPLFYDSYATAIQAHYHRFDSLRETRFGLNFSFGIYTFEIKNERASSLTRTFTLDYGKLYYIDKLSNNKYKVKVGGLVLFTGNMRIDPALQNASFGYEFIYNLMASAKVSRDVSRKKVKSGKFLFIKYHREPRERLLSYQLNLGIVNAHIRNGYSYVNQAQVVNESSLFVDYENKLFQGFRMSSALRYTIYMKTGNALRFAYIWDAYTTGQEDVSFEMANHLFSAAFLFKL